jgi:hypothetical protein
MRDTEIFKTHNKQINGMLQAAPLIQGVNVRLLLQSEPR